MKNLEKRDLYEINGNLTGETIYKGEPVPDNRYIIVALVFMQNSEGKFLIQKRSKEKDGKYGSTGGHAKSGENSIQAMITEISEELGVTVNQNELELIFSGREDSAKTFFDIYYLKKDYDISDFVLQKEEVEFVKWCSMKEIKQLILDGEFLENHAEEVYRLIDIFKEKGIDLE